MLCGSVWNHVQPHSIASDVKYGTSLSHFVIAEFVGPVLVVPDHTFQAGAPRRKNRLQKRACARLGITRMHCRFCANCCMSAGMVVKKANLVTLTSSLETPIPLCSGTYRTMGNFGEH